MNLNNSHIDDKYILFSWECPKKYNLDILCIKNNSAIFSNENKILNINYEDYKKSINNNDITDETLIFILNIQKDRRSISTEIPLLFKRSPIKELKQNEEELINNIDTFIRIIPENFPKEDEDLILAIEFSLPNKNINQFKLMWDVKHFKSENQYLNTRFEEKLKVCYSDLYIGENFISVQFTDGAFNFKKKYIYLKNNGAYGGNCISIPQVGTSMETNFNFTFENWKNIDDNLLYSLIYFDTKYEMEIELKNPNFDNFIKSHYILFINTSNIFVQILDEEGRKNIHKCHIIVETNKNLDYLKKSYVDFLKFNDNNNNLLINIAYLMNLEYFKKGKFVNQSETINEFEKEILKVLMSLIKNSYNLEENKFHDNIKFDNYIYSIIKLTEYEINEHYISNILNITSSILTDENKRADFSNSLKKIAFILENINKILLNKISFEENIESKQLLLELFFRNEDILKKFKNANLSLFTKQKLLHIKSI